MYNIMDVTTNEVRDDIFTSFKASIGFRLGVVLRFRIQIRYSVELNLWSAEMDKMYSEV